MKRTWTAPHGDTLISGAVGGNAARAAMPDKSLGTLGNSLAGLLGGGVGGTIVQALAPWPKKAISARSSVILPAAESAGGLLMVIASLIKPAFAKA